jgi:hypothetical protein
MNAMKEAVTATKDLFGATLSIASVSVTLVAKGAKGVRNSVDQLVPTGEAILKLPFAATEGYLTQEGMDAAEAHDRAYRFVNQPLSVTIEAVGVGSGKLLADLLKEEDTDAADDSSKEEATDK